MAFNKDRLGTSKLMADLQWKTDLSELEKERYAASLELLNKMPGGKIRQQIQYIEKNLLPTVEAKRGGKDSPDYKFFQSVVNSLKWTLIMYDRMDRLMREDSLLKLEKVLLEERMLLYERELLKFTTIEDIHMQDFFDKYDKCVRDKIKADLEGKKD